MPYFIQRPVVMHAVQWTGANQSDVEEWCETNAPWALPFGTDNDDNLLLNPNSGSWAPLPVGGFMTNVGPIQSADGFQEVPGPDYIFSTEQAP